MAGRVTDDGYREVRDRAYPSRYSCAEIAISVLGLFESNLHLLGVQAPGKISLFGTDGFGRDEFSRVLYGGQISIAAGIVATIVTLLVGGIVGIIAGYYGGWIDEITDGFDRTISFAAMALFPAWSACISPTARESCADFSAAYMCDRHDWLGASGKVGARGVVLSARNRNYVLAARGFGGSDFYLLRRHILPEALGLLLTQAALLVPRYIAAEVTLSFFGLGVSEPDAELGQHAEHAAAVQRACFLWMAAGSRSRFGRYFRTL